MNEVEVRLTRLPHGADLPLPSYQSAAAAGLDLVAAVAPDAPVVIAPGRWVAVPTGLVLELPAGTEGQVRPRSGLAARCGMSLLNAPGTIDSGYRGEIKVIVVNHDPGQPLRLSRGDRIAQLVIQRVERAAFRLVEALPGSVRGAGGHGSTGGHARLVAGAVPAGEGER